jgi:hypothetical protein
MTTSGRPPVELPPSDAPGGRPAATDPTPEVAALAALLADVVELAGRGGIFPGDWEQIAEQAMEHPSVQATLADGPS